MSDLLAAATERLELELCRSKELNALNALNELNDRPDRDTLGQSIAKDTGNSSTPFRLVEGLRSPDEGTACLGQSKHFHRSNLSA